MISGFGAYGKSGPSLKESCIILVLRALSDKPTKDGSALILGSLEGRRHSQESLIPSSSPTILRKKFFYLGTARIVRQAYQGRISADLGIVGGKAPFPGIVDPLLKPHDLVVVVRDRKS